MTRLRQQDVLLAIGDRRRSTQSIAMAIDSTLSWAERTLAKLALRGLVRHRDGLWETTDRGRRQVRS